MGSPKKPTNTEHFLLHMDSVLGLFMGNLFYVPQCLRNVDDGCKGKLSNKKSVLIRPFPKLAPALFISSSVLFATFFYLGLCTLDLT